MSMLLLTAGSPLDIPGKTLDTVLDVLQGVGVNVPPFLLQLFLLIVTTVLFVLLLPTLRHRKHGVSRKIAVIGLGLIGLGIVWSWLDQLLFPPKTPLEVYIKPVNAAVPQVAYQGMSVELHDYRGETLSKGTGGVDPTNGRVFLHYTPQFGNPPRKLAVYAPACTRQPVHLPIVRSQLQDGRLRQHVDCERGP
jgi:hypothetical protein